MQALPVTCIQEEGPGATDAGEQAWHGSCSPFSAGQLLTTSSVFWGHPHLFIISCTSLPCDKANTMFFFYTLITPLAGA